MIIVKQAHLHVVAQSDKGMVRQNNEDNFAVSAYHLSETDSTPAVFAILSDGIGGHKAGEVASEMAVNRISAKVASSDGLRPNEVVRSAFIETNQRIVAESNANAERHGMGATLACVWVIGRRLYTASAGDSRIFLIRAGAIQQLNIDHTWIQDAVDKGLIDPAKAKDSPNLHVIRRYLGSEKDVDPDFRMRLKDGETNEQMTANQGTPLLPGDVVLLCSDGLTDYLKSGDILAVMQREKNLNASSKALVDLANKRGGQDNITVVMLMMPWDAEKQNWFNR
jgi:serine/threonine protein phosphatase PrpC